jgi:hypothetical protein
LPGAIDAAAVKAAGDAEGIGVYRAMVDPKAGNRISATDASPVVGAKLQNSVAATERKIGGRVDDLGGNGDVLTPLAEGDMYKGAAESAIKKTGQIATRRYDKAVAKAGDTKVAPTQSLAEVDGMLVKLGEMAGSNSKEIAYLNGLKSDLSKDLSVGALRDLRTKLRQQISKGDLVFGQDEARVLGIMDSAANDIRVGLKAAGKGDAAKAFDLADKAYRARMDYVNGTLQKVIGKRNANYSAEEIARRVASLSKSDVAGFRRFYASLTPSEAMDAAATVAERIGTNGKGEFSVAHFLTQTSPKNMSEQALKTMFGPQGAESVKNLRLLGERVMTVTKRMNSRSSNTATARSGGDWLVQLLVGGGGAGFAGGSIGSAIGGAAATAGAKAIKDTLSVRSLLSPKITKWILSAPNTSNPVVMSEHLAKLAKIAANDNTIAADAMGLHDVLAKALQMGPGKAAADQPGQEKPKIQTGNR